MSRTALVSVVGGLLLVGVLWAVDSNPFVQGILFGHKQANIASTQTPIDAAMLSGHAGLYYLDAGNLTGTLSTDHFSAYQDLQDEKKIGTDSTIITDQNLGDKAVTGVATGLGLNSATVNGTVTVSLVPGTGLVISNGKLVATLGNSIDLNSNETVSILPVAKGGTGLSQAPGANEVLVGTGTGYTYGLLADGDGTKLISASGQFNYSVDSTVCRTSGNCVGAGGGITGSGTPNHLARFSSTGTLSDSILYDTGSALGIGTTSPNALLDIHGPGTTLGTELLANGSFNGNATGWNLYDCGSYANGQATVNYSNACSTDDLSTTVSVEVGKTYQLSFDLVSAIDDQVYWYLDGASGYSNGYDSGSHVDTFTANASGIVTIHFEGWNWNYGSSWTIDDVSVQEVDQAPAFSVDGLAQVTGTLSVNGVLKTTGLAIGDGATTQSGSQAQLIDLSQQLPDPSLAATSLSISQQNTNSDTGSYSGWLDGLDIYQTFNAGSIDRSNGIFLAPQLNGTATANKMDGLRLYVTSTSSGNATRMIGNETSVEHYGTGTITYAYGEDLAIRNFSTGTISNGIGLNIERPTNAGGGTIANIYGLYINDQSGIATGNGYNIYSLGANSRNYFAGKVQIGTTSTANALDVAGAMALGTYAGVNAAPSNGLIMSGKLGVGVTLPQAKVDIATTAQSTDGLKVGASDGHYVQVLPSAANAAFNPMVKAGDTALIYTNNAQNTGSLVIAPWSTASTAGIRMDASGNVGIGASTPQSKLDVNGGVAIGSYAGVNAAPSNGLIVSGNLGLGVTNPSVKLDVAGQLHTTGEVGIGTTPTSNYSLTTSKSIDATAGTVYRGLSGFLTDASTTSSTHYMQGLQITTTGNFASGVTNSGYNQGINLGVWNSGSGTIASNTGLFVNSGTYNSGADTTGTITNNYGIQIYATKTTSSTIANGYGLYINNVVGTNRWAIYDVSGEKSYLSGSLGLGASTGINSRLTFAADTTAAGGILFGTDTNLYRSATGSLKTDGLFTAGTGIVIGSGGTQIKKHLSATTTWDPPSVANAAATSTTVTVTGAAMGDTVDVGFSQAPADGMSISGWVSAANTVKVTITNLSGSPQDLPSGTLRADVWQH